MNLKPCPHCGGTDLQVDFNGVYERHFVRCYNFSCHMQGPEVYGREAAAEAWNKLPRALVWSSETPTVPGWYFTRRNIPGKPLRVMYVKRERRYDHRVKKYQLFMTMANTRSEEGYIIEDLNQPDRLWAGPIPEPLSGASEQQGGLSSKNGEN